MVMEELIRQFVEEFQQPSTLEETKIANLLGHSDRFIALDQYQRKYLTAQKQILDELAGKLDSMDLYKGCCCAFFCGVLMGECGPGGAGEGLVNFFIKVVSHLCGLLDELDKTEESDPEDEMLDKLFLTAPDKVRAFRGSAPLMMAIMDLLAKSPESREYLRKKDLYDNLERIEPFVKNGSYLLRIYPVCGPMDVLVLAPKKEQGALIKVQDVGTNFHLMTLLERALYQKEWDQRIGLSADVKSPESLKVFAYASGEETARQNGSVYAHAAYYSCDGQMLWGEMGPDTIPCVEQMPVVLIYPEKFPRSWDLFFAVSCHPYLKPLAEIKRELSKEEVREWMGKMQGISSF